MLIFVARRSGSDWRSSSGSDVGAALNAPDMATFYTADEKGYTDYPTMAG